MKTNSKTAAAPSAPERDPGRFSSYEDLARYGKELLQEAGRGPQQIANYLSALNGWLKSNAASRGSVVGDEFGKSFDTAFFRYQDLVRDLVSQRTFKDRVEQILWWQRTWQSLLQRDSLPKSFADALAVVFAQSGLTKAELCRRAGLRTDTLARWLSGEHLPEPASEAVVCEVERVLELKAGTLTRRLPMRRRSRYARGQNKTKPKGTRYGNRQRRNRAALAPFALPATERLKEQWLELLRMKTDLARPLATVRNTWRVKPLDRTGTRLHWSMLIDGQACVTASVQYKQVASFLGFLALPKDKGGSGLPAEGLDTLAWMVRADYLTKRLWIDQAWPARGASAAFEIGVPGHQTTYTAVSVQPADGGSVLTLDRGADYFRSQIAEIDTAEGVVTTTLRPLVEQIDHDRDGWIASDDEQKTFWRAKYLDNRRFQLTGAPVSQAAFGKANVLRLWECGVGDRVRQSTSVSVRRVTDGVFELNTDVAVSVSLRGSKLEVSVGGQPGSRSTAVAANGWVCVELPPSDMPYRLRATNGKGKS